MSTLMPSSLSAWKKRAARPECVFMPTPTTATLPTFGLTSTTCSPRVLRGGERRLHSGGVGAGDGKERSAVPVEAPA